MSCGTPSCTIPAACLPPSTSASYPISGLGSLGGSSGGGLCSGGGAASAGSLGILSGVTVSCVNQIPPSEVVIQPAPVHLTIPGPILTASCQPVSVGGYSACGSGSSGLLLSGGSQGLLGSKRGLQLRPC